MTNRFSLNVASGSSGGSLNFQRRRVALFPSPDTSWCPQVVVRKTNGSILNSTLKVNGQEIPIRGTCIQNSLVSPSGD